jgi:hypothetical protein
MGRILAIVLLLIFIWVAIPHIAKGEWIAPTAVAPGSWVAQPNYASNYDTTQYAAASATPIEGYGWFHFDFWNYSHIDQPGQPVQKGDFNIKL